MRTAILLHFLIFVLGLLPSYSRAEDFIVSEVSVFEINSAITPATLDYLKHQFPKVPKKSLLLIKMNTPGGLVTTTKDIITLIGTQERPTAIWITPEGASASSAGSIIAASAHFIFMSPGTNLGAATPVGLGQDMKENDGRSKAINDLSAMVRSLSESRGRPSAPFEEMIRTAKSYTDKEAINLKIIDGIVSDKNQISELINGRRFDLQGKSLVLRFADNVVHNDYEPTLGQKFLSVLADPTTAYFLFIIGVALIYFELQAPGGFVAGGIGSVFLILAAISFQVLPLDWGAFGLIVVGVILLVLEIFVTSYGLLALGGAISFIAGSMFLFHGEGGYISIDYPVIISTLLGVFAAMIVVVWYLWNEEKKRKKDPHFFLPADSLGTIVSIKKKTTAPYQYQVKLRGEIWKGISDDMLDIGERVTVIDISPEQLTIKIKKSN